MHQTFTRTWIIYILVQNGKCIFKKKNKKHTTQMVTSASWHTGLLAEQKLWQTELF